mmetsp:Transcript_119913/g.344553  ORF Transcript_119913/g.344553 Transcript_119913/m.344553 type:complete len:242 (-) Transcript_119913:435-1160(-)
MAARRRRAPRRRPGRPAGLSSAPRAAWRRALCPLQAPGQAATAPWAAASATAGRTAAPPGGRAAPRRQGGGHPRLSACSLAYPWALPMAQTHDGRRLRRRAAQCPEGAPHFGKAPGATSTRRASVAGRRGAWRATPPPRASGRRSTSPVWWSMTPRRRSLRAGAISMTPAGHPHTASSPRRSPLDSLAEHARRRWRGMRAHRRLAAACWRPAPSSCRSALPQRQTLTAMPPAAWRCKALRP